MSIVALAEWSMKIVRFREARLLLRMPERSLEGSLLDILFSKQDLGKG